MKRKAKRTWRIAAAAVLGVVSTAAVAAEDVVVKQASASVLSGKTARSGKVAQLSAGDKVQVLGREGSWLRVRVGDKEGYLHENSVGGEKGFFEKLGQAGKEATSATGERGLSSAAAGKGLDESAEAWAGSKSMNTAGLARMIAMRNSVSEPDWQKFAADGKGGAK